MNSDDDEALYNIIYSRTPGSGSVISQTVSYMFKVLFYLIINSFVKYSDLSLLYLLSIVITYAILKILILNTDKDRGLNSLIFLTLMK